MAGDRPGLAVVGVAESIVAANMHYSRPNLDNVSTHSSSSYERSETGFSEVSEERGPVSLSLDLEREGMPRRKAGRALNPPDMRGRNSSDHKVRFHN